MSTDTITAQAPGTGTRTAVLFDDAAVVAETVLADPGKWFLVGGGPLDRYGVFAQTAYRIRRGRMKAFADTAGGTWEVRVSTDQSVEREYPVEVYLRFVPAAESSGS